MNHKRTAYIAALIGLVLWVSNAKAAYIDEVLADGPVAYWRLNEVTGSTATVDFVRLIRRGFPLIARSAIKRRKTFGNRVARISQAAPVLQLRGSQAQEYSHTSSAG